MEEFACGASDLEAHFHLSGIDAVARAKFELRGLTRLHAKVFVIDWRIAYIGSSNLTSSGLLHAYETAVRISDPTEIKDLHDELESLWGISHPIERPDFERMASQVARTSPAVYAAETTTLRDEQPIFQAAQPNAEESTDLPTDGSAEGGFEESATAIPSLGSIVEALPLSKNGHVEVEPSTDAPTRATPPPSSEQDARIEAAKRKLLERAHQHAELLKRFKSLLETRLGIEVSKAPDVYAQVIRTPSIKSMISGDLLGRLDETEFAPFDRERLYAGQTTDMEAVGAALHELASATTAANIGLLDKYGVTIAVRFVKRAVSVHAEAAHWHRSLLGPLLCGLGVPDPAALEEKHYADAFARLLAAVYRVEGAERALRLCREHFDPLDVLGADVLSVRYLEEPKEMLQNLTQQVLRSLPSYTVLKKGGSVEHGEFVVQVKVDGSILKVGSGRSKAHAEEAAATHALAAMQRTSHWGGHIKDYHRDRLARARRTAVPLFPSVQLSSTEQDTIVQAWRNRYQIVAEPGIAFAALLDPETAKERKLRFSNAALAWFGSHVLELALRSSAGSRGKSVEFWNMLASKLGVEELRQAAGIRQALLHPKNSGPEIAKAIVAALYFANGFEKVADLLRAMIEEVSGPAKPDLTEYRPEIAYRSSLQEYIQKQKRGQRLPNFETLAVEQRGATTRVVVRAQWLDFKEEAEGRNKKEAENKAAWALLRTLTARVPKRSKG